MMKKLYRMVAFVLAAAALCFSLTGCGISDFFTNRNNNDTPQDANASPSASATPVPETATPTPDVSATPEPTKEPVKVEIFYENKAVTELSFQTSTVIRLQAVASDGSTGGIWTSSDASSASVDENGIVTCWKVGNPKITYTIGEASASLALTVTEPTIKICYGGVEKTDISLSGQWGYEIQLTAVVTPEGSEVTWSSEDPAIATVSETGLVTGKKMGYTNIVCKSGTAKAVCIIRVTDNPPAAAAAAAAEATPDPNDKTPRVVITCFGLPNSDFTISVGQSVDLNCTMYNIDPSTNKETWTIEDTAIATVNENGVVTGVKAGTTKVICTVGDVKCETIVRVTDKKS